MIDFTDIAYLKTGNPRQQAAFKVLSEHCIFDRLAAFQPVLAGTIPLSIDIESSDLDILCAVQETGKFKALLEKEFALFPNFEIVETVANNLPTIICRFMLGDFPVEIFGQNKKSTDQTAFRHLLVEHRILLEQDDAFRLQIITLKQQGMKTEPAFAQLLNLPGDPYAALLEFGQ